MRGFKFFAGFLLILGFSSVVFLGLTNAHDFRSGDNLTIAESEAIDNSVFLAGRNIDINTEVFGDVFCAGQTVTISGTVHGDVLCAGQTVRVSGIVDGDVRIAGQTVFISAKVAGNATIAGQSLTLDSDGSIGGDATIGSSDAFLNGIIGRDLAVGGANVYLNSEVGRNIKGSLNNLELSSSAKVAGNIGYSSNQELNRSEGAVVGGEITRSIPEQHSRPKRGAVFGFALGWFVYLFLAMLLVAMFLVLLFPRVFNDAVQRAQPRPWKALVVGVAGSIIVPVLLIVLMITVVGIPLALLLGLVWLVLGFLSGPFSAYYLGSWFMKDSKNSLKIMFVGSTALLVIYFIPIIGFIAMLIAYWLGVGMIVLELMRRTPKPDYAVVQQKTKKLKK